MCQYTERYKNLMSLTPDKGFLRLPFEERSWYENHERKHVPGCEECKSVRSKPETDQQVQNNVNNNINHPIENHPTVFSVG